MAKLVDLFKYKKEVKITDKEKRWIRIIDDDDLNECYKLSRIASSKMRATLRNPESVEALDELGPLQNATKEECIEIIIQSRENQFRNDANANVERPELLKIEEFSEDPDSPTLEEQEKLDTATAKIGEDYYKALEAYVQARIDEQRALLEIMDDEGIKLIAKEETINILALTKFLQEVQDQKIWRAVYTDKECKIHEFSNINEYRSVNNSIKEILLTAYADLEINGDEIKN
jgi:hypothetical protein